MEWTLQIFVEGHWIIVFKGNLEDATRHAKDLIRWNAPNRQSFLIEKHTGEHFYFADEDKGNFTLIPTYKYEEYLKSRRGNQA